jgi:hypothetical protein
MGTKQFDHRCAEGFTYGDYEQSTAKMRTRRERFLAEMEAVVPWKALVDLIELPLPQDQQQGRPAPLPRWRRSPWLPRSGCCASICGSSGTT